MPDQMFNASQLAFDVDVSPDGTQIAVTGALRSTHDGWLEGWVFDVRSRKRTYPFPAFASNAAWSPDGGRLAVGTGMQIVEYDTRDEITPISTVDVGRGGTGSLNYDQSSNLLACCTDSVGERFVDSQVLIPRSVFGVLRA